MDSSQENVYTPTALEAFIERSYRRPIDSFLITPYAYNVTFEALAPGVSDTQTINIAANADFVLMMLHHRATLGAVQTVSTKTAPQVRVMLIDSGTAEQYMSVPVDLENYSTNGNIINVLNYPRLISGRTSLTVQVTNYSVADTYTVLDIMFDGVQVRPY